MHPYLSRLFIREREKSCMYAKSHITASIHYALSSNICMELKAFLDEIWMNESHAGEQAGKLLAAMKWQSISRSSISDCWLDSTTCARERELCNLASFLLCYACSSRESMQLGFFDYFFEVRAQKKVQSCKLRHLTRHTTVSDRCEKKQHSFRYFFFFSGFHHQSNQSSREKCVISVIVF